jgi:hypothetical protein
MTRSWTWSVAAVLVLAAAGHAAAQAPARAGLREEAEQALTRGPFSVMQKSRVPPSGDRHDFMSVAPYWWPDPAKPGGLPYIRRDGEVNPESRIDADDQRFDAMQEAVLVLAQAYAKFSDERFAARAALLLRTWFLDPATRMTPHLNYGQAVPGHNTGRGAGIITTRRLVWIVDALRMIAASPAWTTADQKGLEAWCTAYATWLQTSSFGKEEAAALNNHGTWYDVQLAALLLFAEKPAEARALLDGRTRRRLATQIEPDGRQPHELARTKSWGYSVMNLDGWFTLARLGREVGVDLWNARTRDGRSIRGALDYLARFTGDGPAWPHTQITPRDPASLAPLLRTAAVEFKDAGYAALADRLSTPQPARPDGRRPVPAPEPR